MPDTPEGPLTPVVVAARRTPIGTAGRALRGRARRAARGAGAPRGARRRGARPEDVRDVVLGNCFGPGGNVGPGVRARRRARPRRARRSPSTGSAAAGWRRSRWPRRSSRAVRARSARRRRRVGVDRAAAFWPRRAAGTLRAGAVRAGPATATRRWARRPSSSPREAGVTRERQDACGPLATPGRSHAQETGCFDAELVPVGGVTRRRAAPGRARRRPGWPASRARSSRAATVTAGNSCGINDGGRRRSSGRPARRAPAARAGGARRRRSPGCDPRRPGLGPVPAVRRLLDRHGLGVGDVGAW